MCDPDYDNDGIHEILTTFQLDAVRTNLSADYELLANLSLAAYANWQPIGTVRHPFTGTFDGNNHSIRDLTSRGHHYASLFGRIHAAAISNLHIEVDHISPTSWYSSVGALVGDADFSQIRHVRASINGSIAVPAGSYVHFIGGLVGNLNHGNLTHARVTVIGNMTVNSSSGFTMVGGLVGYSGGSKIAHSQTVIEEQSHVISAASAGLSSVGGLVGASNGNGMIIGSSAVIKGRVAAIASGDDVHAYAGGLVAELNPGMQISDSYVLADGTIAARADNTSYAGGLVGHANAGFIRTSYAVIRGAISSMATRSYAGGLVGSGSAPIGSYYSVRAATDQTTSFTNNYATNRSLEQLACPTMAGEHCLGATSYLGWNNTLWDFGDNRTLPTLRQ